ncbi:D-3-phosphoglycerate dehydrogenase [Clostridium botulinum CFSAN002369]|nr:D-3-phosphoglycerate dehydrogenase [Clostridium botulinum CFSAN002369]
MIKILVSDGMEQNALNKLNEQGFVVLDKHFEKEELKDKIKDFDAIIIRSATKVDKEIIDAGIKGNLKLVVRAGVGLDNVDLEYAKEKEVKVFNTPKASSVSVAELTLGHMLCISRFINTANVTMLQGKWEKKKYNGTEIYGKTLGLIGFGRIAREVAKRANALGMNVIYYDIAGKCEEYEEFKCCTLDYLLNNSDFISVHIPFSKDRGALLKEEEFNKMKDGVYIINCARGGVIEEEALLKALNNGKVTAAALDVFENEPKPKKELINHERVSITPHIGASTKEAQMRIGEEIVDILDNFFNIGGEEHDHIKSFRAIRPNKGFECKIAALPYDVVNTDEAREIGGKNPYSFLHIDRAEIDLNKDINPYDLKVYDKARENLNNMINKELFIKEEKPMLYIYSLNMNGNVQTGIVGCLSIDDYMNNVIKNTSTLEKKKN